VASAFDEKQAPFNLPAFPPIDRVKADRRIVARLFVHLAGRVPWCPRTRPVEGPMGFGQKRKILVRGLARSLRRVDGLGRSFRVVVKKDGHAVVEAETLRPASDAQLASLGAKLLDALAAEMTDVVREAAGEARARVTLRLVQPGTLPRTSSTRRTRPVPRPRTKVH
jgi:hypothetical protein